MQSSSRFAILMLGGLVASAVPRATVAQPKANAPATKADVARLEKQLEEQQRRLDRLIKLQVQYLQSLLGLTDDQAAATDPGPIEPRPVTEKTKPDAKPAAKPEPKVVKPAAAKPGTVVGKIKGGGGDTYVYIEDVVGTARGTATMKQEGKQFSPRVLVVQRGTRVEFPNMDAIFHNVFSVTPDASFDLGSYRQGESKGVTMSKPGVVSVYCNMHPQMVGYVLVVPSNLYARVGADGFYRISNVPAGRHRLVAWAPNSKPVAADVEVAESDTATVELEIKKGPAIRHNNKDGLPYGSYKE